MSQEANALARIQRTGTPRNKMVLMMLADYAPANTDRCEISQRQLAWECEITTKTLRRSLDDLTVKKFIAVENKKDEKGGLIANIYHLLFENWASLTSYRMGANPQFSATDNMSLGYRQNVPTPTDKTSLGYGQNVPTPKTSETRKKTGDSMGGTDNMSLGGYGQNDPTNKESIKETRLDYIEGSDFLSFVKRYNKIADDHENVNRLADDKHLVYAQRINAIRDAFNDQQIETVFDKITRNNWLLGIANGDNGRKFTLNMGYLVAVKKSFQDKTNFEKILLGKHDRWQMPKARSEQHKFKIGEKPYAEVKSWDDELAKINHCKLKTAKDRFARIDEYFDRSHEAKYVIGKGHKAQLTVMVFNHISTGLTTKSIGDIDRQFMNNAHFPDCYKPHKRKGAQGGDA